LKNKKISEWSKLDNAAKIFPANSKKSDTKVFRFSCELFDPVDPKVLQEALDISLEAFPLYRSVMKSGLFWYYFEKSRFKALVTEENLPPCSTLYDKNHKTLLFRVMYYRKRISLEVYHALADGAGALQFLRTLVFHYITIKYKDAFKDKAPVLDIDASKTQKLDDSFQKYFKEESILSKKKAVKAYKLRGAKIPEYRFSVIEGVIPIDEILPKVKEYKASLTIFLAAVLMCAINEEIPARLKRKPVVLSIPVNLRNYFSSQTARNFYGVINVDYESFLYSAFLIGSMILTGLFLIANLSIKYMFIPLVGLGLNLLSFFSNRFKFPLSPQAAEQIYGQEAAELLNKGKLLFFTSSETATLSYLGNIIPIGNWFVVSIGDIIAAIGLILVVQCIMADKFIQTRSKITFSKDIFR
jgi:hypothetical protein